METIQTEVEKKRDSQCTVGYYQVVKLVESQKKLWKSLGRQGYVENICKK